MSCLKCTNLNTPELKDTHKHYTNDCQCNNELKCSSCDNCKCVYMIKIVLMILIIII